MTSSVLAKATLGVVAASVTAAGATYAGGFFPFAQDKEEVISYLIKTANPNKRVIVTKDVNNSHWKEAWKLYREDNRDKNPGEDLWKLEGWTKPNSDDIDNNTPALAHFVSECHERSSNKTIRTNSSLYKEVLRYCTKDTQVIDLIAENHSDKTLLDTSSNPQDTSGGWADAWESYRQQNKNKEVGADPWLLESWESKKDGNALPNDFKSQCAAKTQTKTFDLNNEDYKGVLAWCTK
ncbi:hypothetical protein MHC_01230 [Mycoplasma haemocanis str. Illinois]|uniref:Uncharacterized protein n=1 Tax=Mycoplasma haemocanis (strain Illinois) TaxID=1111676 RepID=H6N640_MYCHN|nr:hypothetical protein [Mycoplasma haemocanis]AEW45112.1 hypothetical protein MHC_01230 [Mycoplasma haemocanis str. Illinois]